MTEPAASLPAASHATAGPRIPFLRPVLPPLSRVQAYFGASQEAGWFSNSGPCHELLSERLAARLGVSHVYPVANCTLGLELVLRAAARVADPVRRLVIIPSYTFAATACAVVSAGLEPLFVDVEAAGWHLDPAALEDALQRRQHQVVAVLACATFGTPPPAAQLLAWRATADRYEIPLFLDAAAGLGAWELSPLADSVSGGHVADAIVYSMHATKPFGVGEGGVVSCNSAELAKAVRQLSNFGFNESREVFASGTNAKLDELTCAVALCVLDDIDAIVAGRRRSAIAIADAVEPLGLHRQSGSERSTWQAVYLQAHSPQQRDAVVAAAQSQDIEVRSYFSRPLHREKPFADFQCEGPLPVTGELSERALALPMANDLDDGTIARIIGAVHASLGPPY